MNEDMSTMIGRMIVGKILRTHGLGEADDIDEDDLKESRKIVRFLSRSEYRKIGKRLQRDGILP